MTHSSREAYMVYKDLTQQSEMEASHVYICLKLKRLLESQSQ